MKRSLLIVILLAGCLHEVFAQGETPTKKEKWTDQYIGVQLNDLIRQVFNFNGTAAANTNPYLLTYSIDSRKKGWGARVGVGYTYTSTSSDDGVTKTDTKINDLHLRIGAEKAFKLSDKWSAGAGLDFIYNSNDDKTTTFVRTFDTTNTVTKTTMGTYGGGPVGWLRYHITSKILIGTEASFYYITGKEDQTIDVTQRKFSGGGSIVQTTETKSSPTVSQGNFNSPIVFFLLVKF